MKYMGALIGFLISIILLIITIVLYYTTVSVTLLETQTSFIFKLFSILYSWPFMVIAGLMSLLNIDIFNRSLLLIIPILFYTALGALIGKYVKKGSKGSRRRRRTHR